MGDSTDEVLEAWRTHQRVHLRLIDAIDDEGLIAHESHHRGNIVLTLKQRGHPVERAVRDGIWDWDRV